MDDTYYSLNSAPTMAAAGGHRPQVLDEPSLGSAPTLVPGGGGSTPGESILGHIDQYELIRKLGGGGFGVVYLARDTNSGVEVALKTLHPLLKSNAEEMDALREKFALVARLTHTNIAKALVLHPVQRVSITDESVRHELHLSPGDSVMVMDYAPGVTLSKWRRQFPDGKVPLPLAIEIGRQIASALDYAHGEKIVHRDIKPSNVMVETLPAEASLQPRSMAESGLRIRILDFGLAAEIRSSMSRVSTEKGDTSGTRPYMAPEQWLGRKQDGRTDQYALACVLYELLSGAPPFASVFETADPVIMANAVENRPPDEIDELSAEVNDALQKALSKNPADRFSNCSEFVAALEAEKSPRLYVVATLNGEEVQGAVLTIWDQKVELPAQLQVETGWTIEPCTVQLDLPGRGQFHGKTEPITVDWKGTKSLIVPLSAITASASNAREADSGPRADAALAHGFAGKRHRFLSWLLAGAAVVVLGVGLWRFVGTGSQSGGPTAVSAAPSVIEKPASKGGARSPSEPPSPAPPAAAAVLPPSTATRAELEDALTRLESHRDALISLGSATDDPERKQVEKALATLRSRIDAALEEETRKAQEEELADRRAAARRTIYLQTLSDAEKTLDSLAGECSAAEAAKLAAATLRKAERARKEAEVKRDSERYEEAAAGYASAKKLFETACAEARAAKADALVGEARAYRESKMWDKCLDAALKALEWDAANAAASKLKEESEGGLLEQRRLKPIYLGGGVKLEMIHCPSVAKDFWIGKYEVTQEQWRRVMGTEPSHFKGAGKPVESVTWNDCKEFVRRLNEMSSARASGLIFRLPTEEEWLTACRAGAPKSADYCKLADGTLITTSNLSRVAQYGKGKDDGPISVGSLEPNAWGLYDMHGNVSEWTERGGGSRVIRGGDYNSSVELCEADDWGVFSPVGSPQTIGLRLAATGKASVHDTTPAKASVSLSPDTATLKVACDLPGVSVSLNGTPQGTAPCTIEHIPAGNVELAATAKGYKPFVHKMRLDGGETQTITIQLDIQPSSLKVVSIPDKARVYIDNNYRGVTPLEIQSIDAGMHRVRLEQQGYDPYVHDIELKPGESTVEEFRLVSNTGTILLTTDPDGVTVLVDGREVGKTPHAQDQGQGFSAPYPIEGLSTGNHKIRVVKPGFHEKSQEVSVTRGEITTVCVKLTRKFIPNYEVTTTQGTFKGVLQSITDEGITLETRPGVSTLFLNKNIISHRQW